MGILGGLFERRAVSVVPVNQWRSVGSYDTEAGVTVTPEGALRATAVFGCIRILSETLASLPLPVYRRLPDGGKERAPGHPLYGVLHDIANPEMTSFTLRETLMGHLGLRGNSYANVVYNGAGQVMELWPLRPDKMRIDRGADGSLVYIYEMPSKFGGNYPFRADEILHIHGLGYNGIIGYSPIGYARLAVGLSLAAEEFGARFFANDARPGIVLEHPGELSQEAHDRLRNSWESRHGSLSNKHRVGILEEGMKLTEIGIPPEDAQFLETRKFQVAEIARIYRIPPHMLADLDRATFSNIEHQSIEFVVHTMRPWLVRWEQQITKDLFLPRERGTFFAEFLIDGLLRGDIGSRYQAYATARQNGWMSANDVREKENQNPIEGGDTYLIPLNMIPANSVGDMIRSAPQGEAEQRALPPDTEQRARGSATYRRRLVDAQRRVFVDVLGRIARRERNDVGNMARKMIGSRPLVEFEQWLAEFYEEHGEFAAKQMLPAMMSYAELVIGAVNDELGGDGGLTPELEQFVKVYTSGFGTRWALRSLYKLREKLEKALTAGDDELLAVTETLDHWEETRPGIIADEEAVRGNNAVAVTAYTLAGILKLRSIAFGENCPYCTNLNGQTIGISEYFLMAGSEYQPEGAERPLTVNQSKRHPPYHDGCDCMVVAGA